MATCLSASRRVSPVLQAALAASFGGLSSHVDAQCTPRPQNLLHWWRGEGTANDAYGGAHGTLAGAPGYATGLVSQAFVFDSDADLITIEHRATFNPIPTGWSLEFWINAGTSQSDPQWTVIDKSHGFTGSSGPYRHRYGPRWRLR